MDKTDKKNKDVQTTADKKKAKKRFVATGEGMKFTPPAKKQ